MNSKLTINGHSISKTQIGSNEFKVSVFQNDKFYFQFNVSLQPNVKDNVKPEFQLSDISQKIPKWIIKNLNITRWV